MMRNDDPHVGRDVMVFDNHVVCLVNFQLRVVNLTVFKLWSIFFLAKKKVFSS